MTEKPSLAAELAFFGNRAALKRTASGALLLALAERK